MQWLAILSKVSMPNDRTDRDLRTAMNGNWDTHKKVKNTNLSCNIYLNPWYTQYLFISLMIHSFEARLDLIISLHDDEAKIGDDQLSAFPLFLNRNLQLYSNP